MDLVDQVDLQELQSLKESQINLELLEVTDYMLYVAKFQFRAP